MGEFASGTETYNLRHSIVLIPESLGLAWKDQLSSGNGGNLSVESGNPINKDYATEHTDPLTIKVKNMLEYNPNNAGVRHLSVITEYKRHTNPIQHKDNELSAEFTNILALRKQAAQAEELDKRIGTSQDGSKEDGGAESVPELVGMSSREQADQRSMILFDELANPDKIIVSSVEDPAQKIVLDFRRDTDRSPQLTFGDQTYMLESTKHEVLKEIYNNLYSGTFGEWWKTHLKAISTPPSPAATS